MIIKNIKGREILDSRGYPTIEVEISTENNKKARASIPSGASKSMLEAYEMRDNDKRYLGMGVLNAINNINTKINDLLRGKNILNQKICDALMIQLDGTKNKTSLGANAMLATSLAIARLGSKIKNVPLFYYIKDIFFNKKQTDCFLPIPMINIINGGMHANNSLDFQEFMIFPYGAKTFKEAIRMSSEIFHNLKYILKKKNLSIAVGDEGGFTPCLRSNEEAIELILLSIESAGFSTEKNVKIALDLASSTFFKNKKYIISSEKNHYNSLNFIKKIEDLTNKFPIFSIEDSLSENDWEGWKILTNKMNNIIQLVGDDIFSTNKKILQKGIHNKVANAILIKPNQIGTLSETLETMHIAKNNYYNTIVSHRSGETEDTFISDLSVGTNSKQIKCGSLSRSERIVKYNRLLRIEENYNIPYLGRKIFNNN